MAALSANNSQYAQMPGHIGASKSKIVLAIVLVSVMALLWAKVLLAEKTGPENAKAESEITGSVSTDKSGKIKIEYTKLGVVAGRHDILMNDMFGVKDWCDEKTVEMVDPVVEPVNQPEGDAVTEEQLVKLLETVKVEMILVGEKGKETEVVINDKIMTVGSTFELMQGEEKFVVEVKELSKNEVVLESEGIAAAISMAVKNGITN